MMPLALWIVLAYLSGALPWSVWLGRLIYGIDPRSQTDGNPGAANAFRVGGWTLGASVLVLDFLKAFIPVFAARWRFQIDGNALFWIALMPTLGHAFSIFLGGRGGRALVTWFGVWTGLTLYEVPLVIGGAAVIATLTLKNDALRSLIIPIVLLIYLLLRSQPGWMLALAAAQLCILVVKITAFYAAADSNRTPAEKRV